MLNSCISSYPEQVSLKPANFPAIPPVAGDSVQPGLAGPVTGSHGNFVLVAGGANFENGLPWRGGQKKYHDEIFLLENTGSGNFEWKQSATKLPFPIAYPACVSTPEGVLSIGGEDQNGPVNQVFLFAFQNGNIKIENLPTLPQAISSAGTTIIDSNVFVVGGLTSKGATSAFYTINLQNKGNGWKVLPELPLALSYAVVVSQNDGEEDCVYMIGGRNRTSDVTTFTALYGNLNLQFRNGFRKVTFFQTTKPLVFLPEQALPLGQYMYCFLVAIREFTLTAPNY